MTDFDVESVHINPEMIGDVEVDGIDFNDAPDFCDAYISRAWWKDGNELSENEIDLLNEDFGEFVYQKVQDHIY